MLSKLQRLVRWYNNLAKKNQLLSFFLFKDQNTNYAVLLAAQVGFLEVGQFLVRDSHQSFKQTKQKKFSRVVFLLL